MLILNKVSMSDKLSELANCIELGKIDKASPYPPDMKEKDGADEIAKSALEEGISPDQILENALIPAMAIVGNKFSKNEIFVPQMLMSAKAMSAAMTHLKPFFLSGETKRKGVMCIGTVSGDLHDIGKNLVAMMIEGGGWEVIDLGVDVKKEKFISIIEEHPGCLIGLSALLTTTMTQMEETVKAIKEVSPETKILIGGAPVTQAYADKIGADGYAADAASAVDLAKSLA